MEDGEVSGVSRGVLWDNPVLDFEICLGGLELERDLLSGGLQISQLEGAYKRPVI